MTSPDDRAGSLDLRLAVVDTDAGPAKAGRPPSVIATLFQQSAICRLAFD
jgi:hypothetical protein